jgi:hypothetical protein
LKGSIELSPNAPAAFKKSFLSMFLILLEDTINEYVKENRQLENNEVNPFFFAVNWRA